MSDDAPVHDIAKTRVIHAIPGVRQILAFLQFHLLGRHDGQPGVRVLPRDPRRP